MLTSLQTMRLLDRCRMELAKDGFHLRDNVDLRSVRALSEEMGKPYFTRFLSPSHSDLTVTNCLWTWVFDGSSPVGMIGARYDELGDENLLRFAERRLVGLTDEELPNEYVIENRLPFEATKITGRAIYIGDLCVVPRRRVSVRCLTAAHLALILLRWRAFDWMYTFARDRDVKRGVVKDYLLTEVFQGANSWTVAPSAELGEHWLLLSSRPQLERLAMRLAKIPDRL